MSRETEAKKAMLQELIKEMDKHIKGRIKSKNTPPKEDLPEPESEKSPLQEAYDKKSEEPEEQPSEEDEDDGKDKFRAALKKMRE